MHYAIKNLADVEDSAAKFGYGEIQEARFPRRDVGADQTGLAFLFVRPGQRQPFAHRHHVAEEVHVVLEGSGRMKLDGEVIEVRPMDIIRVGPGVARAFEAGPDGLRYVVFGPHHEQESELIEDFWPD